MRARFEVPSHPKALFRATHNSTGKKLCHWARAVPRSGRGGGHGSGVQEHWAPDTPRLSGPGVGPPVPCTGRLLPGLFLCASARRSSALGLKGTGEVATALERGQNRTLSSAAWRRGAGLAHARSQSGPSGPSFFPSRIVSHLAGGRRKSEVGGGLTPGGVTSWGRALSGSWAARPAGNGPAPCDSRTGDEGRPLPPGWFLPSKFRNSCISTVGNYGPHSPAGGHLPPSAAS